MTVKRTCSDCGITRNANNKSLPQGQYRCRECRKLHRFGVTQNPNYSRDMHRKRRGTDAPEHWIWNCVVCGEAIQRRRGPKGLYCLKHRVLTSSHRKRARFYGVDYEPVNPHKVFVRDGWRCGICRQKVDKRLKWPARMCATLDHIFPMSRGGGHTYANTQCAHHICNATKRENGSGEQLALIG